MPLKSFPAKSSVFKPVIGIVLSAAMLTACASTATPDKLFAGIDSAVLKTPAAYAQARQPTDTVCVKFYENTKAYLQKAAKPSGASQFLTQIGIGVLAGVATQGLASGIGSTAGRIAVGSAANSAVYAGSGAAMRKLSQNKAGDAKIIALAEQLGCPVPVI